MTKQTILPHELTYLITEEMTKHSGCAFSLRAEVYWHRESEGCNWDVDILGDSNAEAEQCDACIQSAVQALREKYTLEREA
jgi:hypothetical protein